MVLFLSVAIVLAVSFFCSLSEASLLSVDRARAEVMAESSSSGRLVRAMRRALDRPIAAILILNTVANTGGAAVAGAEYRKLAGDDSMFLFSAALTLAVLLLAEIIPKSLGVRYAESASLTVARPLSWAITLLTPLTSAVGALQHALGTSGAGASVSTDDLRAMARLAAASHVVGREELLIIEAAAKLPKVPISDIMIERRDVISFSLADDEQDNLVRARRSLHSRLPVCRDDLDSVVGVVNMKRVLWRLADLPGELEKEGLARILGEEMHAPLFARADDDVGDLIQLFATHRAHMAIVRDQDRAVGMVTLEDVMEEITGEIDDEFDHVPDGMKQRPDGSWRLGGGVAWREVEVALGLHHATHRDIDLDGRLDVNDVAAAQTPTNQAHSGATFTLDGWEFRVARVRRGKVQILEARREEHDRSS